MSEESPLPEPEPDAEVSSENSEPINVGTYTSPLRSIITELHEIYQELMIVGFPEKTATMLVANMLTDVMLYRETNDYNDESDDLDDERGPE